MPKLAKELSDIEVKRLKHSGAGWRSVYSVGGAPGLALQCLPSGIRIWILRYADGKARKELPLGSYPDLTLKAAREKALVERIRIRQGADPVAEIAARREETRAKEAERKLAEAGRLTFDAAVERFLDWKLDEFDNAKHIAQWRSTLKTYASPVIGEMPVSEIDVSHICAALSPIWSTKTETAKRLRGRIEAVLAWATVARHRSGPNPAAWKHNLDAMLPKPSKVKKFMHQPAIALDDMPEWFETLTRRDGMAARAVEFLTLTAARSGEVRGATWSEIDLEKGIWTVPASRMKMRREHLVPLPSVAVRLLRTLPRMQRDKDDHRADVVFWAPRGGQLSDMTLSAVLRRLQAAAERDGLRGWLDPVSGRPAVPHGLRSTFRDWCAERTSFPSAMAELALAHRVGTTVEQAYRRGDMLEKRRAMMDEWADFVGANCRVLSVVEA